MKPKAAPARWPYTEHRTMAEVMANEANAAKPEWIRSDPRRKPVAGEPCQLRTDREVLTEDCLRTGSERLAERIRIKHPGIVAYLRLKATERRA